MKQRRIKARSKEQGFSALEALIVLMVSTLVATSVPGLYARYMDRQSNLVASDQMRMVAEAAEQYIKDNYAAVIAGATPTSPAVITTAMLRSTGYLPAGFSDLNAYGQDYRILALEPLPNKLQTLIVTLNGERIKEMSLFDIAKQIGAKGGYVSATNTSVATGSFGGWQTALAGYGVSPGAGHLATALFFDDGALVNDYLYRHAVPGKPELQQMHAAIDMNANNLDNAGTVSATGAVVSGNANVTGTVSTGNANVAGTVNAASAIVTGNASVAGETYTGGWFRGRGDGLVYSEKWNGGWFMNDPVWLRSWDDKSIYTGGEMRAGKLTSMGRAEVGEYLLLGGIAVEGNGCSPNGLLGRNVNGLALSCKDGVWQGSSSGLGNLWTKTNRPGEGWVPMDCPDGYVMTGITAPMEDWKIIRCRQLR
ncbi:shufflon system plasmid conjugative transfer pilus tip adhesin PilV [Pseudomonas chlororaphis]|uniref:shufflon system plasmid conjugative transfer pilus tip adhesin PilV n=1 Tax=Pseudomonas chlororaphis TaxID=587753 RepID=UPI002D77D114|nr:shufflon system plasmid conjugative transfer pilus tip adhesin PilV [Pseudomonas chlororaphis]